MTNHPPISDLKDNHRRGKVGEFLCGKSRPIADSEFELVACLTVKEAHK